MAVTRAAWPLEHFQAKWNHLATRKMLLNKGLVHVR